MRVLLFLNELSCASEADEATVDDGMAQFVDTLRHVRKRRTETALVAAAPFKDLELAPGYYVAAWRGKPGNRDRWRVIQRFRDRSPVSSVVPEGVLKSVDYTHRDRQAYGLAGAHLSDGLAISLPLEPEWEASWLRVDRCQPVEDADGEAQFIDDEVDIRHASCSAEIAAHEAWIASSGLSGITAGAELWAARGDFFPHLRFLPRVADNLAKMQVVWLRPVRDLLYGLNDAIDRWDPNQPLEPTWPPGVTPEHQQRRRLCQFEDLDGTIRVFDKHVRFAPEPGRLHFRWDAQQRAATVAHIGRKLGE